MAKDFVARAIWNPYTNSQLIETYCEIFPELKHVEVEIHQLLDRLVKRAESSVHNFGQDIFGKAENTVTSVLPNGDELEETYGMILEVFLDSFTPFVKQLKKFDEQLLAEKECVFLQHLEIQKTWKDKRMTENFKTHFWKLLNGAWLIAEFLIVVPEQTMKQLQGIILDTYNTVIVEKKDFEKEKFRHMCKKILGELKDEEMAAINSYFMELIVSDCSPIFYLVPLEYHGKVKIIIKAAKSPLGKKLFTRKVMPMLKNIKTRKGETAFKIEGNDISLNEGNSSKELNPSNRSKLFEIIVDAFTDALGENKGMLSNLLENPKEGITELFGKLIPSIMNMVTGSGSDEEKDLNHGFDDDDAFFSRD